MSSKLELAQVGVCVLAFFVAGLAFSTATNAQGVTSSLKGTVSVIAADPSAAPAPIAGARLSLVNRDLKGAPVKTVTDETGQFAFLNLPAATYVLTAEADNLPSATKEIRLTTGATLVVDIVLTATVSESVTVREEEGLLSTSETTTSNTVRSQKLLDLPLRADNYQSALPLTPGVVRGMDGADHVKGARAGQNAYTVNGADVTDPVNGNLAFDIPIEAAASVHIEENPYSAEFGRFSGGATNLETKTGGNKFKLIPARIFPVFRNIISGPLDSFRPRLTFSGPVVRQRLNFVQALEYRFSRTRVPSLEAPHDDSILEGFNSFTQLDLIVNKRNTVKFVGALFPQKVRYVGLDTFNPQPTTPDTKQRGLLFSVSEQAIFHDESFLSSLVSYKTFSFDVFPVGPEPLTILPDGNEGNYFADTRRSSRRLQWQENYFSHPFTFSGQHTFKLGAEFYHTGMSGVFNFKPILIRRRDRTLSQRIEFTSPSSLSTSLGEFGAFAQDHWVLSKNLTLEAGLRWDRNSIAKHLNISPRFSIMYLPFKNDRTIVRGGVGIFYDRSPLQSRYFNPMSLDGNDDPDFDTSVIGIVSPKRYPARIVTTFAPDGLTVTDGPRLFLNALRGPLRDARSTRWSLQVDRGLTKHLTARIGYLERSTTHEALVVPHINKIGPGGLLVLKSTGHSQYRELQMLAVYNSRRFRNFNVSYTWSRARGDLNTADDFFGDFPAFVIRPNQFGPLPFDAPHRFLAYGEFKARWDITISPAVEIHSGFPFSAVNEQLDFIGLRNQAGRFPTYFSLDAQFMKGFKIPFLDKHARLGIAVFNITNHFNPRDVQNNIGSLNFGQFFNSLGTNVRAKVDMDF